MRRTLTAVAVVGTIVSGLLVALPGTAWAAGPWFVANGGLDTNNCTTALTACATINGALGKATAGDTINVAAGTYVEKVVISKAITIQGPASGVATVNASATAATSGSTVTVNIPAANPLQNVVINKLTMTGGFYRFGGGIDLLAGNLTVNDSIVTGNKASATTGGVSAGAGTGGAGIFVAGKVFGTTQQLTLNRTTVSNNQSIVSGTTTYPGAGIYAAGPTFINDSTISGNNSTSAASGSAGGGLYINKIVAADTATVVATNTTFSGNFAVAGGGIASSFGSSLTLQRNTGLSGNPSQVISNTGTFGAGIFNSGAATVSDTLINANTAASQGGGVWLASFVATDTPTLTATNTIITNNIATANAGGGVIVGNKATFTANTSTIGTNAAVFGGGLFVTGGGAATLNGSGVNLNNANGTGANFTGEGGGIYVAGPGATGTPGQVTVNGGTVNSNTATANASTNGGNGGGAFVAGTLNATNSAVFNGNRVVVATVTGSAATGWGGAIYTGVAATNDAPVVNLTDVTVSGGGVPSNASIGGGVAAAGNEFAAAAPTTPAVLTTQRTTFSANNALVGGGAFVANSATFNASSFTANTTPANGFAAGLWVGKGIAADAPNAVVDGTTFRQNVAAGNSLGGAIGVNAGSAATVRNGSLVDNNTGAFGAGIYSAGTTTIPGSDIKNNVATVTGAGFYANNGGSINMTGGTIDNNSAVNAGGSYTAETGSTTLTQVTLSNNVANGGATNNNGNGGGAWNAGVLNIANSTISGNQAKTTTAPSGTNIAGEGGGVFARSTVTTAAIKTTITGSTITGNSAVVGSALETDSSVGTNAMTVINSTVTANTASGAFGAIVPVNPISIIGSTVTNNTATTGGSGGISAFGTVSISGSIISGNKAGAATVNCQSTPADGGYNLTDSGDTGCGFTAAKNDVFGNPQLGALANNGGLTQTQLPAPNSPVINRIPNPTNAAGVTDAVTGLAITLCPGVDQRAVVRPQGPKCDIGAVEIANVAPTLTGPATATYTVGAPGGPTTFTSSGAVPSPAQLSATGALPAGVTFTDNGDGTGKLQGTPAANTGGTYPLTIKASNGVAPDATLSFTLTVNQAPAITGPTSATYAVGAAGATQNFSASGFPAATLSLTGALPPGVSFNPSGNTATISGTPAAGSGGVWVVTVNATNGVTPDAHRTFTLTVTDAATLNGPVSDTFNVGFAGSDTFTATGFPVTAITTSDPLPAGVTFTDNHNNTATIAGTPLAGSGGVYVITMTATNSTGTATHTFTLTIHEGPVITGPSNAIYHVGTPGGPTNFSASGTPTPSLTTASALPNGVTFTDNGDGTATIAGTPAPGAGGAYPIDIVATNTNGTDSHHLDLTVNEDPTISGPATATYTVGTPGAPLTYTTTGYPQATLSTFSLPNGVTFTDNGDGTGTIAGTPAANTGGTYMIFITASNGLVTATTELQLTINQAPALTGPSSANYVVGQPGTPQVFSSTGYPVPTVSTSDPLPAGVTLVDNGDGTATLAGTPSAGSAGNYAITITAGNGVGTPAQLAFTLHVGQPPTVAGPAGDTFTVGVAGGPDVFTTTGFPTPSLSTTDVLPGGVTFSDNGNGTATIAGTPAAHTGGTYSITVTAANGVGSPATTVFFLVVHEAPTVSGPASATYTVGTAGGPQQFTSTGYPVAALSATNVPAGLTFVDNHDGTGKLSGTPAAGTGGIRTVTVTASNGVNPDATTPIVLTINERPGVSGPATARFYVNTPGSSVQFTTTGFPVPGLTKTGGLPSGVTFTDNGNGTATIAGTPAFGTAGTYTITITAANGVPPNATMSFTLTVVAPVAVTTSSLANGSVGVAYSAQLTATGGATPYTWSVASGTLPAGLTLGSDGKITGSPTGPTGTSTFTVKVTDSLVPTQSATRTLSITIDRGPTTLTVGTIIVYRNVLLKVTAGRVSATLTGGIPGQPLGGQTITWTVPNGTLTTTVCTAITNSSGYAQCDMTAANTTKVIANNGVDARYAGSALWQPAQAAGGKFSNG